MARSRLVIIGALSTAESTRISVRWEPVRRMDPRQILRLLVVLSGLNGACDGEDEVFVCFSIVLFTVVCKFGSFN